MNISRIFPMALILVITSACNINPNDIDAGNFACRGPDDCIAGYQCTGADSVIGVCYDPANPPDSISNAPGHTEDSPGEDNTNTDDNTDTSTPDDPTSDPACGNRVVENGEMCDEGEDATSWCEYGMEACEVCNDDCELVPGDTAWCGDGELDNAFGEVCDDGETNGWGHEPCINHCTTRHPWPIGQCHDETQTNNNTEHNVEGLVAFNFEAEDHDGNTVRLYDFCNRVVIVNAIAAWSAPDQQGAQELNIYYENNREKGLMVLTLMVENSQGNPPTEQDLRQWVNDNQLDYPVLADPDGAIIGRYHASGSFGHFPVYIIHNAGAVVEAIDEGIPSPAEVEILVP